MRICCAALLSVCFLPLAAAADWPAWRGPDANAVAIAGDYPVEFGPGVNEQWRVDLPGTGSSTPVVEGDSIYVTATVDGQDTVCCYGLDGQERWRRDVGAARKAKNRSATGSNPSVAVDAKHVVAYFKSGTVACLTHEGQPLWSKNLQKQYGEDTLWWDLGTSPVLSSAGVVIAVMQDGDSYLVTLALETGDVVWKQPRMYQRPRESDQAYTTPAVLEVEGVETIVTWGADHLTGHDAATGELLWDCGGFNPDDQGMWRVIASATIVDGVAYVPYGRANFVAAVKIGGRGDITQQATLWNKQHASADVPSPVVADGKVYLLNDRGAVNCLAAASGDILWTGQLPRSNRKYYSSPLLAGNLLYCIREDGAAFVVDVTKAFELVAENDLGDDTVATPVPVGDSLLIRTRTKLFRFGN